METETVRGLLIGVGIASLVGMPTQNPLVLLTFLAVIARFEHLTRTTSAAPAAHGASRAVWLLGFAVAVGYAGAHLVLARGPLKPLERAARTHRDYVIGTYPQETGPQGTFRWTGKHATFAIDAPTRHLSIRFHVEHPDAGSHPVKVRISTPCQTLVDEFRTDATVDARSLELPEGVDRLVFDVDVSRTWQPASTGVPDPRNLGAAVQTDFVSTDEVVRSQNNWLPIRRCAL